MELKKVNQELYSVEKYGGKIFFKGSRKECFRIMRRESVYNAIRKAIDSFNNDPHLSVGLVADGGGGDLDFSH